MSVRDHDESRQLVYLRINDAHIDAFVSPLPPLDGKSACKLHFRKQIKVADTKHLCGTIPRVNAVPLFDEQRDEIIWATSKPDPTGEKHFQTSLWRIGPHFAAHSFEDLAPLGQNDRIPSVVLPQGSCHVNVPTKSKPAILKQHEDGSWVGLAIKSSRNMDAGLMTTSSLLFGGINSSMKYIYNLRMPENAQGYFFLDVIRETNFVKSANDKTLLWQTYKITDGFPYQDTPPTQLITYNEDAKEHILFTFRYDQQHSNLIYSYIKLREDGSVISNDNLVNALRSDILPYHDQDER